MPEAPGTARRREPSMPAVAPSLYRRCLGAVAALVVGLAATSADAYPDHVIRLIVPFPAGGSNDVAARLIAPHLEKALGQAIIVDNPPAARRIVGRDRGGM